MQAHTFKIGNPCGPCEWHIVSGIRIFAWFDLIFQAVFVVPVILQFKIFLNQDLLQSAVNDTECDASKAHLALDYSITDVINLSLGMLSDVIIYIGAKQDIGNLSFSKACAWLFLVIGVIREALHVAGLTLHMIRCSPETYPYEIVVRLLCQYMLYGVWIGAEYLIWMYSGCLFVPRRGLMEPPTEVVVTQKTTSMSVNKLSGMSSVAVSSPVSSGDMNAIDAESLELMKAELKKEIKRKSVQRDNFESKRRRSSVRRKSFYSAESSLPAPMPPAPPPVPPPPPEPAPVPPPEKGPNPPKKKSKK